ncbi:MAG TPA: hypothetical protein VFA15_08705, partial [Nitrososphaera sp.]|nr:hypothetical protein [Nitrososphaera sp.]
MQDASCDIVICEKAKDEIVNVEPNRVGGFPFRKADPAERKSNFTEVQQPYSEEEVMKEAERCL